MRVYLLSHVLKEDDPVYPGTTPLRLEQVRSISRGDTSNSWRMSMGNHVGTHVDAPNHFDDTGLKVEDLRVEDLVIESGLVVEVPKAPGGSIEVEDLRAHESRIERCGMLMIRTGLQAYRWGYPSLYSGEGVSLHPDAASYVAAFSNLKALGIDAVSISSPLRRELGRAAHRRLLVSRRFLIVEDMDLAGKPISYDYVILAPLRAEKIDGAPCTVFGIKLD
ncbi:MAG: cyclase family protein [Thaumarchaeota archaeon]|nr:cyclase family protein [Candidatus Calditenuaceae archaeon]MDW8187433.1 cyclase family protein [Nitrososphaerota archaeon]